MVQKGLKRYQRSQKSTKMSINGQNRSKNWPIKSLKNDDELKIVCIAWEKIRATKIGQIKSENDA